MRGRPGEGQAPSREHRIPMKDNYAPETHRQRMVAELRRLGWITEDDMHAFTKGDPGRGWPGLTTIMGMNLIEFTTSLAPGYGWAGTGHWDFSGFALMAWDKPGLIGFLTIDLHSCKPYDYLLAVRAAAWYWAAFEIDWAPVLHRLAVRAPRQRRRRWPAEDLAVPYPEGTWDEYAARFWPGLGLVAV